MPRYLTAGFYRAIGLGVDLSETSDSTLESHIATASALANVACAAPTGHDFRGGTITNEAHGWDVGNKYRPGSNRVYPYHRPIRSAARLAIEIVQTPSITMSGDKLYVEEVEGWVEPIALTVATIGVINLTQIPTIGLRKPVARIDYTYGWDFTAQDEELVPASGGELRAANQFWFTDEEISLKKNGSPDVGFTYDAIEGTITPATYDNTATYSVTYHYPLPSDISRATAMIMSDLIGYTNINASGLSGLSGIRVEEIELRQSSRAGFIAVPISPAVQALLAPYRYMTLVPS